MDDVYFSSDRSLFILCYSIRKLPSFTLQKIIFHSKPGFFCITEILAVFVAKNTDIFIFFK